MKLFLCALLVLSSCSFKKTDTDNQTLKGHHELYSEPTLISQSELSPTEKRIVLASTNDVKGIFQSQLLTFKDDENPLLQNIRVGGVDVIQNYFKILREHHPNLILVDSGNLFNTAEKTSSVNDFYSFLNYDALTIGLRDFNLKVPKNLGSSAELFQKFAKEVQVPFVLSNLYDLKTARLIEWKGTKPYHIKEIDGVKVGILGIIPDDIVGQTPVNNRVGLFVENMLQSTLRHARLLRSLGADMIVVLTHQGIDCGTDLAQKSKLPLSKVNFEPDRSSICNLKSPLGQYLERLPPNLVDVVVGGRINQKMANIVNGTLVMSSFHDGKSFNYAEFIFDTESKKIKKDKTVVHQPVMFCHEFFKDTNDCFTEDASVDHKKRIPATFLGKPILRDLALEKKFPGLSKDRTVLVESPLDFSKSLMAFNADISFIPKTSGESQLQIVTLSGAKLARILEEDFNEGVQKNWHPSPFLVKEGELQLMINGEVLRDGQSYRVIADLESLQNHQRLLKQITNASVENLASHSWNSFEDQVSSVMSGQSH